MPLGKKIVDQCLNEMAKIGLVERRVLCPRPIAVTDFGASTLKVLEQLRKWAEAHDI